MDTKLFEIRDYATCVVVCCTLMQSRVDDHEHTRAQRILSYKGYNATDPLVLMADITGGRKAEYDPYAWNDRTFQTAHEYISKFWYDLVNTDIVDVEFLRGESEEIKKTDFI